MTTPAGGQRPFLLAHLSDLHLGPIAGLGLRHLNAKRLLGLANWHRARKHQHLRPVLDRVVADILAQAPDHVALTGDLVNLGLPLEHEAALAWLGMLGPPDKVSVVPGNHDAYVRMRRDTGHGRWYAYMSSNEAGACYTPTGQGFPYVRRLGAIAVVGLASGIPTPVLVSSGRLGRAQREALAETLRRLRDAGLVRVVLIHHHPHRYGQAWRTGLQDIAELEDVLAAHGAELLLHGHIHRHALRYAAGPDGACVPLVGVPSASAALPEKGELAGWHLYRIWPAEDGKMARIEMSVRGLAAAEGPVVELRRQVLTE
jgi:3',5'-cyclic AMP phosphodiesterase CpdA